MPHRNSHSYSRFFTAFFLAASALALQFRAPQIFGIRADVLLTACIVIGFFLSFREFLILLLGSAWALNWQPAVGWELALFISIPIIFFFAKRLSPWQPWLANIAAIFFAGALFHLGIDSRMFLVSGSALGSMLVFDLLFGALVFETLRHFYAPTIHIYF